MRTSDMLQIGKAGEYLTCADLILKGFVAFPSEQGLPFDVVLDNGKKLLRVQVKTTEKPRVVPQRRTDSMAYMFSIKRHGKNNSTIYENDEVDIFALVCLDTKNVGYIRNDDMPCTINLRVDANKGLHHDEKGIATHALVTELSKTISNQSEIARVTGIHVSQINRILEPNYVPYSTTARYFSDIIREKDWFLNI